MAKKIKFGIVRETKTPPDRRVPATPEQCVEIMNRFPNVELFVQKSNIRCFADIEYEALGIPVIEDISECDILIGIKEVKKEALVPNKMQIFFSHTAKKQAYNRGLLQEILNKKVTLLDHEYFTDRNKNRLVAFGKWAGIVGAYNALIAYGNRYHAYHLKRAKDCFDFNEMIYEVRKVKLPAIKILITGNGRVAKGAMETLAPLHIKHVSPDEFLNNTYNEPVICQLDADQYTRKKDGKPFEFAHFFKNPEMYESTFLPFTKVADMYIACHFWDPKSPVFWTKEQMASPEFKIRVIADVSCDIALPIPSTLRPSTIAEPFYGVNPRTAEEGDAFNTENITVMAIDNLPGELPRNSSEEFGKGLIEKVYPSLFGDDSEGIIERAMITKDGKLTPLYSYLQDFVDGK